MIYLILLIAFIFGAILGSFVNVVIICLEKNKNLLKKKRSQCPHCKHKLSPLDLIPILSFFLLKRKCRYCKKKISWRYLIIELVSGSLITFTTLVYMYYLGCDTLISKGFCPASDAFHRINEISLLSILYLLIVYILVELLLITFIYDLRKGLISNGVIITGIIASVVLNTISLFHRSLKVLWSISSFGSENDYTNKIITLVITTVLVSLFFWSLHYFSKGKWLGGGDVKLIFWISIMFGWPLIWMVLLLGFMLGSIISIMMIYKRKKNLKSRIALGPFLALSAFVIMLFGDLMFEYYLRLFGLS